MSIVWLVASKPTVCSPGPSVTVRTCIKHRHVAALDCGSSTSYTIHLHNHTILCSFLKLDEQIRKFGHWNKCSAKFETKKEKHKDKYEYCSDAPSGTWTHALPEKVVVSQSISGLSIPSFKLASLTTFQSQQTQYLCMSEWSDFCFDIFGSIDNINIDDFLQ